MKIIYRAYVFLMIAVLATALFFKGITLDVHFHDRKFVIVHFYIGLALAFYILLLTIANYWIAKHRKLVSFLQWLVFLITALVCLWILCASIFQSGRYYRHDFNQFQKINEITSVLSLFFVLANLSFWIYFLYFLVRKTIFRK